MRSRIDGNTAESGGGIFTSGHESPAVVHIIDSLISGNTAQYGYGGGLWNGGIAALANSTVSGNSALESGGGILTAGPERRR